VSASNLDMLSAIHTDNKLKQSREEEQTKGSMDGCLTFSCSGTLPIRPSNTMPVKSIIYWVTFTPRASHARTQ
jgi:hypothetical protein